MQVEIVDIDSEVSEETNKQIFLTINQEEQKNNNLYISSDTESQKKIFSTVLDINHNNNHNYNNDKENKNKNKNKKNNNSDINNNNSDINNNNSNINNNNSNINNSNKNDSLNGWDMDAIDTLDNWYEAFQRQSFVYQFILDRNYKMSNKLNMISVIFSSLLGIFSAFKLWIANDSIFQTVSNILLMFSNFTVALITTQSKRFIDDKKNEQIRTYIEDVDVFLGHLSAQYLKSYVYRMNADDFFKTYNDEYTKIISSAPNLSLYELELGHSNYVIYKEKLKSYNTNNTNNIV
jgi:hypothetical protein